jgi:hypothetical protein
MGELFVPCGGLLMTTARAARRPKLREDAARVLTLAVTDLGTHATFLASEFPSTLTGSFRTHTRLR